MSCGCNSTKANGRTTSSNGLLNLGDYKKLQPTKSCYLDGRYFNKVFANYPGLISEPLVINLKKDGYSAEMPAIEFNTDQSSLLRVIIEAPGARHSTLLILNHRTGQGYWFQPFPSVFDEAIRKILAKYIGYQIIKTPHQAPDVKSDHCPMSGFCNAYIIKYAYDYINDLPSDMDDIKSFASRVESEYPKLIGKPDIAYGFLDNPQTRNSLIGGLGGAAIGGLVGGGSGLLIGGLVGGIGGYALSGNNGIFR